MNFIKIQSFLLTKQNFQVYTQSDFVSPRVRYRVPQTQQEAWLQCQNSWLYFESIFSAPDIQRQLPAEAKLFATMDKSFRDIMKKVAKVPLAIRAGIQAGELFKNLVSIYICF